MLVTLLFVFLSFVIQERGLRCQPTIDHAKGRNIKRRKQKNSKWPRALNCLTVHDAQNEALQFPGLEQPSFEKSRQKKLPKFAKSFLF